MNISPILKRETCASCKICCEFKPQSLIYVPKGIETIQQENGMFACAHRSEEGCKLGKDKPMECCAWPFSVSRRGDELLLVLEHSCPELNKKEKLDEAKKFAMENVAEELLEYSRKNLEALREYDGRSEIFAIL
jgi:hypothetical protein